MQNREKLLLYAVVALVGLMGVRWGYNAVGAMFDLREGQVRSLSSEIERKKLLVEKGRRTAKRLAEFELRSLPTDKEAARSQYQHWLMSLVEKAGLSGGVTSQSPQSQRGVFDRLTFTVNAAGTLDQLVRLLHDFSAANHLHQVRMLSVKPIDGGKRVEVLVSVEALSLPTAKNALQLASEPSGRLQRADLAAYRKAIVERNIFAEYTPPVRQAARTPAEAPARPASPPFDPARYTTVTGIVSDYGRTEVWLNNRTSGKLLRLGEGGTFEVGDISGTVAFIGSNVVEVSINGQRATLTLGQSLREATPIQ
jgi:hypothetical protein